jgi:hypothetical protein
MVSTLSSNGLGPGQPNASCAMLGMYEATPFSARMPDTAEQQLGARGLAAYAVVPNYAPSGLSWPRPGRRPRLGHDHGPPATSQ